MFVRLVVFIRASISQICLTVGTKSSKDYSLIFTYLLVRLQRTDSKSVEMVGTYLSVFYLFGKGSVDIYTGCNMRINCWIEFVNY